MEECIEVYYHRMCNFWEDPGMEKMFQPESASDIRTYPPQRDAKECSSVEYSGIGLLDCYGITVVPMQISSNLVVQKDGYKYKIECILGYGCSGGLHFDFYVAVVSQNRTGDSHTPLHI